MLLDSLVICEDTLLQIKNTNTNTIFTVSASYCIWQFIIFFSSSEVWVFIFSEITLDEWKTIIYLLNLLNLIQAASCICKHALMLIVTNIILNDDCDKGLNIRAFFTAFPTKSVITYCLTKIMCYPPTVILKKNKPETTFLKHRDWSCQQGSSRSGPLNRFQGDAARWRKSRFFIFN